MRVRGAVTEEAPALSMTRLLAGYDLPRSSDSILDIVSQNAGVYCVLPVRKHSCCALSSGNILRNVSKIASML